MALGTTFPNEDKKAGWSNGVTPIRLVKKGKTPFGLLEES